MSKVLRVNDKGPEAGVLELLKFLIENDRVEGVVTLTKTTGESGISYSLITDPEKLSDAVPLSPVMPANAGKLLSYLTLEGPTREPLAIVAKPCEIRAFIELVKRRQGSLDNILMISQTCPGVYPLDIVADDKLSEHLPEYWEKARSGEPLTNERVACNSCVNFIPHNADLIVSLIGKTNGGNQSEIFINTEKGEAAVNGMEGKFAEGTLQRSELDALKSRREEERRKVFEELGTEEFGIKGMVDYFGKCIGCHACGNVCPICYCQLCFFDSRSNETRPYSIAQELSRKGATRLPPGTIFYHLGRLAHMGISCVGCGLCTDVCPTGISVSSVFSRVGDSVQGAFDYVPGMDLDEAVPVTKYEADELSEIGE
jgi:formate dehydrogenase subunit beta